jgi:hypothetical protein
MSSRKRNVRISVASGMSGYFAVMLADYEDMHWDTCPVMSGIGRYKDRDSAIQEAKEWSKAELIPLEKGLVESVIEEEIF